MMYNFIFDPKTLALEDEFAFSCYKGISCFNKCCYDVKLVLSPYDFLRLRKSLNLEVEDFIKKYGELYLGEVTQLPVISINIDPHTFACPFLNENEGCTVYKDRPSSCRLYPLARFITKNEKGESQEVYKIIRETHCKGHYENRIIKIKDYLQEQELLPYLFYNDLWGEVIIKRQKFANVPLTGDLLDLIFIMAYDLSTFKERLEENYFLEDFPLDEDTKDSEEKLLEKGLIYIRDKLLTEENLFKI